MSMQITGDSSAEPVVPSAPTYVFPTTFAQQRLWFLEQLQPGGTSYLVAWSLRISGQLNVEALERSLNEIIRRHEVLRTTFSSKDGRPAQVIADSLLIHLSRLDLSSRSDREAESQRLAREEARKPLDLERGPLVRAQLLQLGDEEHVLLLTMHHIIFDGWSRRILVSELAALYQAFCAGQPSPLRQPKLQYPDYAVWQRKQFQGRALEKQLSYWRKQLAGAPASLDLATDRPRPALQTFHGARLPITFSPELRAKLTSFSREHGATLFMTLLAGFQVLLARYSNQDDIVVGTPIANRNRAEIEEMIGFFANTLVLRTQLSGDPTFSEALARVKETALGAYSHQDLPFEKLVEDLQPERTLAQNPLFQVLFSLQNAPRRDFELEGLKLRLVETGETAAKFDISLFLTETAEELRGRIEYNTDLFDENTIQRMMEHYRALLEAAVSSPELKISQLPLLTHAEKQQILVDWNSTQAEYPRELCLHQLIERQAERTPQAIACVQPGDNAASDHHLTYRELNRRSNQLAHALRGRGVGPGQRVAIFVERSLDMMVGLLGIQKAGAAYVPLDPSYPAERIRVTLADAQPTLIITQQALLSSLPSGCESVICIDSDWPEIARESTANIDVAVAGDDVVYVIFTSGSTGRPKGVQVRHRSLVNLLTSMAKELDMGTKEVFPALASFAFDMCIPELYLALISGGRVIIGAHHLAANGEDLAELLRRTSATIVHATPTTWSLLLEAGFTGKGLKRVIGAEPLPRELCKRLLAADDSLYNFYGPTETTVWSAFHHFRSADEPVVLGRPLANTQIYILDKNLQPVPVGVPGEIHIGGDGVAAGYLGQPELSAAKFIPDPFGREPGATIYKTGDLGRFLPDGRIEFQGRSDHQVKIRGYRIELGEIEAVIAKHAVVQECVVIAREDVPGNKRLVAYVIPSQTEGFDPVDIRAWATERLPVYMVPVAIVAMERFPLTPNGKVDRKSLPAPEYGRGEAEGEYQAPGTPAEEMVAAIWAEVLKLDRVGVQDNFFELGGHSLLATQVVSRIRLAFQIELPLRTLFEAPTVAGLAAECEALQRSSKGLEAPALTAVSRAELLPLSFAQQRLWFLDKLEPNNPLYNVPHIVRLQGKVNIGALERALNLIVRRHESLRTTFQVVEGSPVQVIAPSLTVSIQRTDLSKLPEEKREAEARRLAAAEVSRPFDLARGPLVRSSLFQLSEQDRVFIISTHHIISDRWSLGILAQELAAFYEQEDGDKPAQLPALPVQYADYAAWQRQFLSDETLAKQLGYWKENLAGAPASLDLPTDRPRPAEQSFRGAKYTLTLPPELTGQIKALGRKESATLFMTLLAAFDVLLARYSGQDDVVIGSPIAGRTRPEVEKLIGLFINTLIFRSDLSSDPSFRELIAQVRRTAMAAYAHQELPFEKLVQELKPERDLSRNPIFQVMFILQNAPVGEQKSSGLEMRVFPLPGESSKFDLTLIAAEGVEGLRVTAEYNSDLFDRATLERMMDHYRRLLEAVVETPERRISELRLLSETESRQMLVDWNATSSDYPRELCLHQLFERQAKQTPEAIAVSMGGERISYGELDRRTNRMAHALREHGVGPETTVGIFLERSINMVAALVAVLKAGGAYIPLDPAYPAERIEFILNDAQCPLLLTQKTLLQYLPQSRALAIDIESVLGEKQKDNGAQPPAMQITAESLAYVLYTSGSTGRPKGVQITHGNLVNFLLSMQKEPGLNSEDRLLAVTTLSFDIAGLELYLPLVTGAEIILASRNQTFDGRLLLELMRSSQATVMQATPATWRMLIEAGWAGTAGLKVLCGGEALPGGLAAQLLPRCAELWNMYGPTETTIWSSVYRVQAATATAPIGRPIANTTFYVLDTRMQPVPAGVAGELYIGGEGVARGYFQRPELTAEKFVSDPFSGGRTGARLYRTGDLARFLPDGNLQYLGRTDFQVKIRGFRIELGEIESALAKHPAVQQAVVAAREDSAGDKRLVCYLVPQPGEHLDLAQVRSYLKQSLPEYMLPSAVVELTNLPLTPNGKVDRKSLPAPGAQASILGVIVPPRDELEASLLNIWRDVLQTTSLGITDNFFDLGGHSLMAARLVSEIERITGRVVPLAALFRGPTVESMAQLLREKAEAASDPVVMQIQSGEGTPFFAVVEPGMQAVGYATLAHAMGPGQSFYKLQSPGQKRKDAPVTLPEMRVIARQYIAAMRTVQPAGPYYFGGMCGGTHIAEQMVLELEENGEEVGLFAIFDTWVLQNSQIRWLWRLDYYRQRIRSMRRLGLRMQFAMVQQTLAKKIRRIAHPFSARVATSWSQMYWPGKEFKVPHFRAPVALFKRPRQPFFYIKDEAMGWNSRTSGGVEIHSINFPHRMLREPYVRELATRLRDCLSRAAGEQRSAEERLWEPFPTSSRLTVES